MFNTYPRAGVPDDGSTLTNYDERRGRIAALAALAVYRDGTATVGEPGSTERESITRVSPEFFATLGAGPAVGRAFTEGEMTYQTDHVVILTDPYWRQRYGRDHAVLGRRIRVDGIERVIVGVLPPDFSFLSSKARLYFPLSSNAEEREPKRRHSGSSTHMIARLRPGATLAEAQSQIDAHNAAVEGNGIEAKAMADAGFRSIVEPLHAGHVAAIRPTLLLMQAGALFLLLIGALNLVNLLLIRASQRVRELAVRQAIGAGRRHIVSEVVVETTTLTLGGGLLGLVVGAVGIRLLPLLGTDRLPLGTHIALDLRVALTVLVGALVLGVTIAAPIAWYSLRQRVASGMQFESRGSTASRAAQRLRHGFIVAQIGLAFALLSGAGLLGLSLNKVMALSPGFRPERVLTGQISLPWSSYQRDADRLAFVERLIGDVARTPGVLAAGIVTNVPLSGNSNRSSATVKGRPLRPGESPRGIYSYSVGGDYFTAMGLTLREGRFVVEADSRRAERVCVVDEDFARRYWPTGGAVGQRVFQGTAPAEEREAEGFTIVGVVGAAKQDRLTEDDALGAVYYPFGHRQDNDFFVVTRTSAVPQAFANTLRPIVRAIDPDLPVNDIQTMDARIEDSLVARRSPALLAGVFSGIAMLLTALGTYGVLSYAVAQRRREIALRMALGAQPAQIRRQFVSLALGLLAAGSVLGVIAAWITGQAMQTLLYQVPALHAAVLIGAAATLSVVSLAACLLPSHRATRVSPMEALADQ